MGPTKDQQRAKFAWEKVTEAERLFGENFEKYVNFSKSAPTLVMSNGLMQALAFLQSRKEDQAKSLVAQICGWLGAEKIVENGGFNIVMEGLSRRTDGAGYRRATEETLEILKWIRQLADAIKKKTKQAGN